MVKSFINLSRRLRKNQTPWEAKLWSALRNRNISNLKFRRQYRIENFIVDFYCPDKKLVIELDGSGHLLKDQEESDKKRDTFLKEHGYIVLRFLNTDIDDNLEGVAQRILEI